MNRNISSRHCLSWCSWPGPHRLRAFCSLSLQHRSKTCAAIDVLVQHCQPIFIGPKYFTTVCLIIMRVVRNAGLRQLHRASTATLPDTYCKLTTASVAIFRNSIAPWRTSRPMIVVQHRLSGARSTDHAQQTAFLPLILAWPCVLENNNNRLTSMRMQFNYEARAWLSLVLSLHAPVLFVCRIRSTVTTPHMQCTASLTNYGAIFWVKLHHIIYHLGLPTSRASLGTS